MGTFVPSTVYNKFRPGRKCAGVGLPPHQTASGKGNPALDRIAGGFPTDIRWKTAGYPPVIWAWGGMVKDVCAWPAIL